MTEKPQVIRWEDPPPAKKKQRTGIGRSRYAGIAEQLRARPGAWALVAIEDHGLSTHIRMGQTLCFAPGGDFDAVSRRVDGQVHVYARYLGDPGADDA